MTILIYKVDLRAKKNFRNREEYDDKKHLSTKKT